MNHLVGRALSNGPETWVQSQVESYQRHKKWNSMTTCLTIIIIRYGSRVKWSNQGRKVASSQTPLCSTYFVSPSTTVTNFISLYICLIILILFLQSESDKYNFQTDLFNQKMESLHVLSTPVQSIYI